MTLDEAKKILINLYSFDNDVPIKHDMPKHDHVRIAIDVINENIKQFFGIDVSEILTHITTMMFEKVSLTLEFTTFSNAFIKHLVTMLNNKTLDKATQFSFDYIKKCEKMKIEILKEDKDVIRVLAHEGAF